MPEAFCRTKRRQRELQIHAGQFTTSAKKKPVGGLSGNGSSMLGNPAGKSDRNSRRGGSKKKFRLASRQA